MLIPSHEGDVVAEIGEKIKRGEGDQSFEAVRITKGGRRIDVSITVSPVIDTSGKMVGLSSIARDITERKRAEEALRETECRLARTEEFSLVMVTHTDLEGRWLKVPPTLCNLLGYTETELLGRRFHELTHPDDLTGNVDHRLRLLRGEIKSFDIEKRYIRKDGGTVWVYINVSIVTDAKDNALHCLSYIRDISERKQARGGVAGKRRSAACDFRVGAGMCETRGSRLPVTGHESGRIGYDRGHCLEQVIGQSFMAVISTGVAATYEDLHRRVCQGESAVAQFEIIGLKGKTPLDGVTRCATARQGWAYHRGARHLARHHRP
jgi:PAS domain S-box-containing protein